MFTVDLANAIFVICVAVGGILLLITVLLDDVLGGLLDFIHLDFDLGGVTLMPLLLGFVSMFGIGGLFGTEILRLGATQASLVGAAFGFAGAGLVYYLFRFMRRAEAPPTFGIADLRGQRARVSVAIAPGRYGEVLLSYQGTTQNIVATSDVELPVGTIVFVTDVAGTTVVVKPAREAVREGGTSDA